MGKLVAGSPAQLFAVGLLRGRDEVRVCGGGGTMEDRAFPTPKDELCNQQIHDTRAKLSQRYVCFSSQGGVKFRDSPPNLLGPGASRSTISAKSRVIFADLHSCTGDQGSVLSASSDYSRLQQEPTYTYAECTGALSAVLFAGAEEASVMPKAFSAEKSSSRIALALKFGGDTLRSMAPKVVVRH